MFEEKKKLNYIYSFSFDRIYKYIVCFESLANELKMSPTSLKSPLGVCAAEASSFLITVV